VIETTKDRQKLLQDIMDHFGVLASCQFEITNDECPKTLQVPHRLSLLLNRPDKTLQVQRFRMMRDHRVNQRHFEQVTLAVVESLPEFVTKYQDLEMTIEADEQITEFNRNHFHG
jgi:hypothetical protein